MTRGINKGINWPKVMHLLTELYDRGIDIDEAFESIQDLVNEANVWEDSQMMCVDCGNPTMHSGTVCYSCSQKRSAATALIDLVNKNERRDAPMNKHLPLPRFGRDGK